MPDLGPAQWGRSRLPSPSFRPGVETRGPRSGTWLCHQLGLVTPVARRGVLHSAEVRWVGEEGPEGHLLA